ncbi:MAG: tyrosine-type recombinase/integrase [Hyphomicrobiaceae bacterium]|nr:tyrosine-type recombinase/integrase [Hyphomicrobiaceae bacterium]
MTKRQARQRITERMVSKWCRKPAHAAARDYFDSDVVGLCLKVQPTGAASWCFRYVIGKTQRRLTLGDAKGLSVEGARKAARVTLAVIAEGRDPAAEKQARRHAERESTVHYPAMVELFIRRHGMVKNRRWRDQARTLGLRLTWISARRLNDPRPGDPAPEFEPVAGSLAERWLRTPVREITRADIAAAVQDAMALGDGKGAAANTRLAQLKSLFSWLHAQGFVDAHPCEMLPPPAPHNERERVLSLDEIRALWAATAALEAPYRQFVRVLALTGQRRSEVAQMRWAEIAGDTWIIPAARAKNGDAHAVTLSPLVLAELASLSKNGPHVFTSSPTGATAIQNFSDIKEALDRNMPPPRANDDGEEIGWTFHDLRRTAATGMADLGVLPHVIEAVLNHRSGRVSGIARTYNRNPYEREKRAALDAWAARVAEIVRGAGGVRLVPSNIVALGRSASA